MIIVFQITLFFSILYVLFALLRIISLYFQDKKALKAWEAADQIFQNQSVESLAWCVDRLHESDSMIQEIVSKKPTDQTINFLA